VDRQEQLHWKRDDKFSEIAVRIPLWRLLESDPGYLRHEIERAAREFGFHQISLNAMPTGWPMAELTIRYSQTHLSGA